MTMNDFHALAKQVRNWGRWGSDDELGALNYITAQKVIQSAGLVRKGTVLPLGLDLSPTGPQGELLFRRNPTHVMTVDGGDVNAPADLWPGWSANGLAQELGAFMGKDILRFNDDMIIMHTQAATQWDALSHVYYDGQMYNGFGADTVTSQGAFRLGIEKADAKGITSRGVLLDVVRHRGDELAAAHGRTILPDELSAIAEAQGVEVGSGDIVLVHTGWAGRFRQTGDKSPAAGLDWRSAAWFHEREVAALAADNTGVEDVASDIPGNMLPMHLLCLRDMGMSFGELWDLTALAADCAADGVYEFQLVAPPLRIVGGVGSPLNPLAIK
ncbi:cyclase family protein [Cryptosporangium sp. NPDC051539]|uniref:cyclase family protein n=1 Tax=Cryptosporangium sp. NPDC051539 TaxID=3363962 RepID=UPI0037A3DC9D